MLLSLGRLVLLGQPRPLLAELVVVESVSGGRGGARQAGAGERLDPHPGPKGSGTSGAVP